MAARANEQYTNIKIYNLDETSDDIEELSHEIKQSYNQDIAKKVVGRFKSFRDDLETSFERERSGMEEYYENEKSDIIKGFMLEKKVLHEQHDEEKQSLIQSFVKERQKLLQNFQKQVKDVEMKIKRPSEESESAFTSVRSEARTHDVKSESPPSKLLIRVGGNRIVTPEEFLATLELEEKFESEKETIEKSFRKEKDRIKDKLEIDYERKLLREKQKHDGEIRALQSEIEKLKNLKFEVATMWKQQASKIETEFHKERAELETHYKDEKESLRKKLEDKHSHRLNAQQQEYDRSISELKSELRRIKKDASKKQDADTDYDHSEHLRHALTKRLQESFERETKIIREQNEKLSSDIKSLTTEKYELHRRIRELEVQAESELKLSKNSYEKLKKECDTKAKKILAQNDKLRLQVNRSEKEKEELLLKIQSSESCGKNMENRLVMTERTVAECEDIIINSRLENSNLSHEINLLRREKDELMTAIANYQEKERNAKCDLSKLENEAIEASGRYALLEREKLQHEKFLAGLRKELESSLTSVKKSKTKCAAFEKEANRLRQLLECERKETKRLHERFKQDAELLRKKENENASMCSQLDQLKTEFQNVKNKMDMDNEKVLRSLSEKQQLIEQIEKLKLSESLQQKHEIVIIQNQYVKEFAKRLDYVKSNYEREIKNLRNKINTLKQKQGCSFQSTNLESTNQWKDMEFISDFNTQFNLPSWSSKNGHHEHNHKLKSHADHRKSSPNFSETNSHHTAGTKFNVPQRNQSTKISPFQSNESMKFSPSPHENLPAGLAVTNNKNPISFSPSSATYDKLSYSNTVCERRDSNGSLSSSLKGELLNKLQGNHLGMTLNCENENVLNHNDNASAFKSFHQQISPNGQSSYLCNNKLQNSNFDEKCGMSLQSTTVEQERKKAYPWNNNESTYGSMEASHASRDRVDIPIINDVLPCHYKKVSSIQTLPAIPEVKRNTTTQTYEINKIHDKADNVNELFSRVYVAETRSDNEELRALLKDVRKEVLLLNKMIDENTPGSTPRFTPPIRALESRKSTNSNEVMFFENNKGTQEQQQLQNELTSKENEANDSKEEMKRLYMENSELQRRITEQQEQLLNQETSCEELLKRRMVLEKLVDRLQRKLRDEASKRRQLEQEKNAIDEDSKEDLDDSTV